MRILLTGATGYIGRNLAGYLARQHQVFAVVRDLNAAPFQPPIRPIVQDLTRRLDCEQFPQTVDTILHLAQSRQYRDFPNGATDIFSVNTASTAQLLDYARLAGATRFVLVSTGSVYAPSNHWLEEGTVPRPVGYYATSKYAAELLTYPYQDKFQSIICRPFFVYGPHQPSMLIPTLFDSVLGNKEIEVRGEPGLLMNPIYIGDVVRALKAAATRDLPSSPPLVTNLAGDDVVSMTGLLHLMAAISGRQLKYKHLPGAENAALLGTNSRMKHILGVSPETGIETGLKRMLHGHDI